jgi:predicted negative regulator of RcsB-dependent stress response
VRVKTLLVATALISMIVGAVIVYLVLTVPNDIQAGALLKSARKDIAAGRADKARDELARIVQQYPRTDAAAAATVALASLEVHERQALQSTVDAQKAQIADLQKKVAALAAAPPPAPVVVPAPQPPPQPKPAPAKKKPVRKKRRRR